MSLFTAALLAATLTASPNLDSQSAPVTFGDALLSRAPQLADEETRAAEAVRDYFDADTLITLGALALAVGGLAAARRTGGDLRVFASRSVKGGTLWPPQRINQRESSEGAARFEGSAGSNRVVTDLKRAV